MTSLDMAGCSITLLRLDDDLTSLWDAPVKTPALRWGAERHVATRVVMWQPHERDVRRA